MRRFEDAQVLLEESRPPAEKKSGVVCCCYCPLSAPGAVDNIFFMQNHAIMFILTVDDVVVRPFSEEYRSRSYV